MTNAIKNAALNRAQAELMSSSQDEQDTEQLPFWTIPYVQADGLSAIMRLSIPGLYSRLTILMSTAVVMSKANTFWGSTYGYIPPPTVRPQDRNGIDPRYVWMSREAATARRSGDHLDMNNITFSASKPRYNSISCSWKPSSFPYASARILFDEVSKLEAGGFNINREEEEKLFLSLFHKDELGLTRVHPVLARIAISTDIALDAAINGANAIVREAIERRLDGLNQ